MDDLKRWLAFAKAAAALVLLGWGAATIWTGTTALWQFGICFLAFSAVLALVFWLVPLLAGAVVMPLVWPLTHLPRRNAADIHGSARWARGHEIKRFWLRRRGPIYLASWCDRLGRRHALTRGPGEHILVTAPSRSGKTAGIVVPTMLAWPDAVLCHDEKGEIYDLTQHHRRRIGNRVMRFAPAENRSAAWNPLDAIRADTEEDVGDALNLATVLAEGDGPVGGDGVHWQVAGIETMAGAALHCLYRARDEGKVAGFGDVLKALSKSDELYAEMAGSTHPMIRAVGNTQTARSDRERSSVTSTAVRYLQPWRSEIVCRNTARSDFTFAEFCDDDRPMSLYLCTRSADAARVAPVQRLFLSILSQYLMSADLRFDGDGSALPAHRHRVLFMLDEFNSLGRAQLFQSALSRLGGYGVTCVISVQSIQQIWQHFGRAQSLTSNCGVRCILPPADYDDARWASEQLGVSTVSTAMRSRHVPGGLTLGSSETESVQHTRRSLMTPDEILTMSKPVRGADGSIEKPGAMLVIETGRKPIAAEQLLYFRDAEMRARASAAERTTIAEPFPTAAVPAYAKAVALALFLLLPLGAWTGFHVLTGSPGRPAAYLASPHHPLPDMASISSLTRGALDSIPALAGGHTAAEEAEQRAYMRDQCRDMVALAVASHMAAPAWCKGYLQ